MFVLLIGLPGPRPRTTARARAHVSFLSIKRSSCGNISRLPTRVPLRRGEIRGKGLRQGRRWQGRQEARAVFPSLTAGAHPLEELQFPFCARACTLALAQNGCNIVRLCLHLIRRRTGYTEPCLWPVSHVRPAVGAIAVRVNGVSSTHDRAPRIFATVALKYPRANIAFKSFPARQLVSDKP